MNKIFKRTFSYIIFLIFINFGQNTYSQELKGRVLKANDLPIESSVVALQNLSTNEFLNQNTNNEGNFLFQSVSNGKWIIQIKSLGYGSYIDTLEIKGNKDIGVIILEEEYEQLEEITINFDRPVIKYTPDGVIVDIANSYLKTMPSTMDVLGQIPEIFMQDGGISVLGKSKIAYYINGRQSGLNISSIPVASIERVELITNPTVKYDGNIDAIINVILKKSATQGFGGELSLQYEQRTAPRYSLTGAFNYNKGIFNSTFTIGHSYSKTKNTNLDIVQDFYGFDEPFSRITEQKQESNFNSQIYGAEMSLNFNNGNILSFLTTWQPNHVPNSNFKQDNQFISNQNIDSLSSSNVDWQYNTRFLNSGLMYDFKINKVSVSARFDLLWQDDTTNTYNDFYFDGFNSAPAYINLTTDQFRKSVAYVPSIDASYNYKEFKFDFGAKYYNISSLLNLDFSEINSFTPNNDFAYEADENIFSTYLAVGSKYKKLTYQVGVRGEFSTLDGNFNIESANQKLNKLLPSLHLFYGINDLNSLYFSYTEKIQRPAFSRISPLYYFNSPFDAYEGNPYLVPEKLGSFQLRYSNRNNSLTIFYNDYENTMQTLPFNRNNITVQKFSNTNLKTFGALLSLQFKHTNWLTGYYSVRASQQQTTGIIDDSEFQRDIFSTTLSITEHIKFSSSFNMNVMFNYIQPSLVGLNRIQEGPYLNFSFNKVINENLQMSLFLRDIFKIGNEITTTRDFDGIRYSAVNTFDSRGVNFSLTYKFNQGKKTNTKKLETDEARRRL